MPPANDDPTHGAPDDGRPEYAEDAVERLARARARLAAPSAQGRCTMPPLRTAEPEAQAAAERRHRRRSLGLLDGVPVAVKDNVDVAGVPTSMGSAVLARGAATHDAAVVARLRRAGALVVAKTNLDEAALGAAGENVRFGRVPHPHDPALRAGGSSAGSAAVVAAGDVPLAVGTDTLGSVRIPAALCGIAALKCAHDPTALAGVHPLYAPYDALGLLAKDLDALAVAWGALGGRRAAERRAPVDAIGTAQVPETIRLACLDPAHLPASAAGLADAYERRVAALAARRDVELRRVATPDLVACAGEAYRLVAAEFCRTRRAELEPAIDALGPTLRAACAAAWRADPARTAARAARLGETARALGALLAGCEAWLLPATPRLSLRADAPVPDDVACFTVPANLLGRAAVVWPDGAGLPLQLVAVEGDESALLALARRLAAP